MDSFKNSLAYWSSILATGIALLGAFESLRWLVSLGLFLMAVSLAALLYAWKERRRLKLAAVTIAGRRIDALNLANLERRLNRTLFIQELDQVATINGEDVTIAWRYSGYCRAAHETSVEFSIDMDNHVPFDHLDCVAYDLRNDPHQRHGIKPVLLGADGLSKKIAVPLLERLAAGNQFSVRLICSIPGCMKSGVEYYTSTTSVTQPSIPTYAVRLVFLRDGPRWLRVYECDATGNTRLLRELRPSHRNGRSVEYVDLGHDVSAQSARIYLFHRTEPCDPERRADDRAVSVGSLDAE